MTFNEQIVFIENNDFDTLLKFAKERDFIKYINPYAVSSLNLSKIRNFLTACVEEKFKKTKLKSKPYKLVLDPTNGCNLGCPLCPTGLGASLRKKGVLKINQFIEIIEQFKEYAIEVHLYNWGEPTLNKKLNEMLSYCRDNNLNPYRDFIDLKVAGHNIKYETNTMLITNKNIDVHKNKFVLRRPCVQIDLDSVHITSRKKIRKLLQRDLG